MVWKITQIYQDKIYVVPQEDPTGAIPTWIGDEIPVPRAVASEVGSIRQAVEKGCKGRGGLEQVARKLATKYSCGSDLLKKAVREIAEQVEKGYPVPTDQVITVEKWQDFIVINCCFGHLVNRTLARVLGHTLSLRTGSSVGVHQDPYRIMLHIPSVEAKEVQEILLSLTSHDVEALAVEAFTKTGMFKRRLIHVARKSGVLAKNADLSNVSLSSLIEGLKDSVVYEEAVKTVLDVDSDVSGTADVVNKIAKRNIGVRLIQTRGEISPIARIGMEEISRRSDVVAPASARKIILESTKARLLSESRVGLCTSCWDYHEVFSIREVVQDTKCPECGSSKIAFLNDSDDNITLIKSRVKSSKSKVPKKLSRFISRATLLGELYAKYGFPAAVATAGRGLRISDMEDILRSEQQFDDRLIESLIEAEKKALKRRYFGS